MPVFAGTRWIHVAHIADFLRTTRKRERNTVNGTIYGAQLSGYSLIADLTVTVQEVLEVMSRKTFSASCITSALTVGLLRNSVQAAMSANRVSSSQSSGRNPPASR